MRFAAALLVFAGSACSSDVLIQAEIPASGASAIPDGWTQFVAVTGTDGAVVALWAFDPTPADPITLNDFPDDLTIFVVATPIPLANLTTVRERIQPIRDQDSFQIRMLENEQHRVLARNQFDGRLSDWGTADFSDLPTPLLDFRMPASNGCLSFDERTTNLGVDTNPSRGGAAVALDERSVLVASTDGVFFVVDRDGARPVEALDSAPNRAGFRDDEGYVWLFGTGGAVARVDPADWSIETRPDSTVSSGDIEWVAGTGREPSLDIYTLNRSGVVAHFDGQNWTRLGTIPADFGGAENGRANSDLTLISRDEVLAVSGVNSQVLRVHKDGSSSLETVSSNVGTEGLGAVLHMPGDGTYVATNYFGFLYRQPEGSTEWQKLPTSEDEAVDRSNFLGFRAYGLAPAPRGVLMVGGTGARAQYVRAEGFCPALSASERTTFETLNKIVAVGASDFVALTDASDAVARAVYFANRDE